MEETSGLSVARSLASSEFRTSYGGAITSDAFSGIGRNARNDLAKTGL